MKKLLSIMLALGLMLSAGSALAETIALKVWGSQEDQAMLMEMAESFKAANPDKEYDISFGVVTKRMLKASTLKIRKKPRMYLHLLTTSFMIWSMQAHSMK